MTDFIEQTRDDFDSECWEICYELGLKESQAVKINEYLWKHFNESLTEAYRKGIKMGIEICEDTEENMKQNSDDIDYLTALEDMKKEIKFELEQKLKGE